MVVEEVQQQKNVYVGVRVEEMSVNERNINSNRITKGVKDVIIIIM